MDASAINYANAGTTALAWQAYDIVRTLDLLDGLPEFRNRPRVLVGEGYTALAGQIAAVVDKRIEAVACVRTVPSYLDILETSIPRTRNDYWFPGAILHFDRPDLSALIAPRHVCMLDSVDAELKPMPPEKVAERFAWPERVVAELGAPDALAYAESEDRTPGAQADAILQWVQNIRP
jgi:hypothetical protein